MALVVKNPPANAGDTGDAGLIPRLGRSPGKENGNPLQYFLPGEFHGNKPGGLQSLKSQSRTRLSD